MKATLLVLLVLATTFLNLQASDPVTATNTDIASKQEILQLLATGEQAAAEDKTAKTLAKDPQNLDYQFMAAVMMRSRFDTKSADEVFYLILSNHPDSLEGLTSACILTIDNAQRPHLALFAFSSLLILSEENPDSVLLPWMVAVESRTLTKNANFLPSDIRTQVLRYGIDEYKRVLAVMAPNVGPVLIHQTLGNLLDDAEAYDGALQHREMAIWLERSPWSLQATAETLNHLDRSSEALPLVQEAIHGNDTIDYYYTTLGTTLRNLGRKKEAIEAWQEGLSVSKGSASYPYCCSLIYQDLGDYIHARDSIRTACALNPTNRTYQILEARFSALCGEPDAVQRLRAAGTLDFNGNAVAPKPAKDNESQPDPWFAANNDGDIHQVLKILGITDPSPGEQITPWLLVKTKIIHESRKILAWLETDKPSAPPRLNSACTALVKKIRGFLGIQDVNARDPNHFQQTALMIAAECGWEQIASNLIKEGANLDLVDRNGDSALHYSAQFHQNRVMKLLLDAGAKTDLQDKWSQTPLVMCIGKSDWDAIQWLLDKKANLNLPTPHGGTPLHYAAGYGELNTLKKLIAHGANVNAAMSKNGETPLMRACTTWQHPYIVSPLIAAGANVNAQDKKGETALYHSISPLLVTPLVELLLEKGADPTLANTNGITPIIKARLLGYEKLAAQMEKKTGTTETPHFAPSKTGAAPLSLDERRALLCILPIQMAMGRIPDISGITSLSKNEALNELSAKFGISSSTALTKRLLEMKKQKVFHLESQASSLHPSLTNAATTNAGELFRNACLKIHSTLRMDDIDENAWIKARIIYMAELGMNSGLMSKEEGQKTAAEALAEISNAYSSWESYLQSFNLGIRYYQGWEYDRYENIAKVILQSGIPYTPPAPIVTSVTSATAQ